jgi:hypothetical protein
MIFVQLSLVAVVRFGVVLVEEVDERCGMTLVVFTGALVVVDALEVTILGIDLDDLVKSGITLVV